MRDDHLRLSDEERDRAAAALADHYAQGRLTPEEHAERLDRVWAARTRGELLPVFRDLPGAATPGSTTSRRARPGGQPAYGAAPARRSGLRALPAPVLALLGVLLVITVITHLPLILIGLLVWVFVVRTNRGHYPRRW